MYPSSEKSSFANRSARTSASLLYHLLLPQPPARVFRTWKYAPWSYNASFNALANVGIPSLEKACIAGTSSFGMSGVNAHLLLHTGRNNPTTIPITVLQWQKTRLYALCRRLSMCVSYTRPSKQHARFSCPTAVAGLSWLWDASILGRHVLSTTAAMECAASAVRLCHEDGAFCLSNVTLEEANILPEIVYTDIDLRTGGTFVESEQSAAILSCSVAAILEKAPAMQQPASRACLHSVQSSGTRAVYSSLADQADAEAYAINPRHAAAALSLRMMHSPLEGMVRTISAVSIPDEHLPSRGQAALSTDSSAMLSSTAGCPAAFENIVAVPLEPRAASNTAATNVLYRVDWLVDTVRAAQAWHQGIFPLSFLLPTRPNSQKIHARRSSDQAFSQDKSTCHVCLRD